MEQETMELPIGPQQLRQFDKVLQSYHTGLARTKARVVESENWWKLRNAPREREGEQSGFRSVSGWLHNVIVSKHADAMDALPEPVILPREASDRQEANMLSAIIPCVLEQNRFDEVYAHVMWQKLKSGTGVYKVVWDSQKLGGLGDIRIDRCNLLNLYWEPGITDIQDSRYFFHTRLEDRELLEQQYPELRGKIPTATFQGAKFFYDDTVSTADKAMVVEVYYHKYIGNQKTLQYCRYVGDTVLYATENTPLAPFGLYDHGMYPYIFDPLYPMEGSPCGYGYVDICRNPQMEIDLLKTAFVKNAMVGATPRYFKRADGGINEEQFLDLNTALVEVSGAMDENALRQIGFRPLDGVYVSVLDRTIQELRETSGNTETSTGSISSGVTAASAIVALQEASGKGSRDSTRASYQAFSRLVNLTVELIRQFYSAPRNFRILGAYGAEEFISYDNARLLPQDQGAPYGIPLGYRTPVFDIKVSAQKKSAYTRMSQNELANQFFQLGFFDPAMAEQALMCLELMDFDGKEQVMQKVAQNALRHAQSAGGGATAPVALPPLPRPDPVMEATV